MTRGGSGTRTKMVSRIELLQRKRVKTSGRGAFNEEEENALDLNPPRPRLTSFQRRALTKIKGRGSLLV